MTAAATVGVVVPAAGRDDHLRRLLGGLARQTHPPDDVVVADMGDATAVLAASPLPVRRHPVPADGPALPLAAARNAAAAATDAEVLVFLDVDSLPHCDLVADYAGALSRWGPVLACGQVRYLRQGWDDNISLQQQSDPHPARPTVVRPTIDGDRPDLFWSLNFATQALTWRRLGGFDEDYIGYGAEDTDLGWRAQAAGVPLLWLPGAARLPPVASADAPRSVPHCRDRGQRPSLPTPVGQVADGWVADRPGRRAGSCASIPSATCSR